MAIAIETLSLAKLVVAYGELAKIVGGKPVKAFKDKPTALKRVGGLVDEILQDGIEIIFAEDGTIDARKAAELPAPRVGQELPQVAETAGKRRLKAGGGDAIAQEVVASQAAAIEKIAAERDSTPAEPEKKLREKRVGKAIVVEAAGKSGRTASVTADDKRITIVDAKRLEGKPFRSGQTIAEFLKAGGTRRMVRRAARKGAITLGK